MPTLYRTFGSSASMPTLYRNSNGSLRLCCCDLGGEIRTCGGFTFRLPLLATVTFPNVSAGTCLECNGKGGSRTMKLRTAVSTVPCFYVSGNCCRIQYDLCVDGVTYPEDNGGACGGAGGATGWILHLYIPVDGVSDVQLAARILTGCSGGGAVVWTKEIPWRSNFVGLSDSLPFDFQDAWVNCAGAVGSNAALSM